MLSKYYSLDECYNREVIFDYLDGLQNESIIYYAIVDTDVIKIRDSGLTDKQMKDLVQCLEDNDVIDYSDYHSNYMDDEEDDDYDDYDDDYYTNDNF